MNTGKTSSEGDKDLLKSLLEKILPNNSKAVKFVILIIRFVLYGGSGISIWEIINSFPF